MDSLPVVIEEPSTGWAAAFEAERRVLQRAFEPEGVTVEHIGSTAVPGLGAKPIIDILLGAASLAAIERHVARIEAVGYRYVPAHERTLPQRRYFAKPGVHLHAVEAGGTFWIEHLAFRDALRASPALAAEYLALKRGLAERFGSDRDGYTEAKAPFVREVILGSLAPDSNAATTHSLP